VTVNAKFVARIACNAYNYEILAHNILKGNQVIYSFKKQFFPFSTTALSTAVVVLFIVCFSYKHW
jgi:hypothetical protein